jgi:hypothetical protein
MGRRKLSRDEERARLEELVEAISHELASGRSPLAVEREVARLGIDRRTARRMVERVAQIAGGAPGQRSLLGFRMSAGRQAPRAAQGSREEPESSPPRERRRGDETPSPVEPFWQRVAMGAGLAVTGSIVVYACLDAQRYGFALLVSGVAVGAGLLECLGALRRQASSR